MVARHDDELFERGWRRRKGIEAYASCTKVAAGDRRHRVQRITRNVPDKMIAVKPADH